MKIKIRKILKEKRGLEYSSANPIRFEFSKFLNVYDKEDMNINKIFNKKLIFYDLETSGLERGAFSLKDVGDQIHQIAALAYNIKSPEEISSIRAENPDDQYISKIEWRNDVIDKRDMSKYLRYNLFDKLINTSECKKYLDKIQIEEMFDTITGTEVKNISKAYSSKKKAWMKTKGLYVDKRTKTLMRSQDGNISKASYYMKNIYKNYNSLIDKQELKAWKFEDPKISHGFFTHLHLSCKNKKYINLIEKMKMFAKDSTHPKAIKLFELLHLNKDESVLFYDLFLDNNSFIEWVADVYGEPDSKALDKTLNKISNKIGLTVAENKKFTQYDNFPKQSYIEKNKVANTISNGQAIPMKEKEALEGFFDFLSSQGEYILIGQNINAFDNPFVVRRSKLYKIPKTKIRIFSNSFVYDTRALFLQFIKYLNSFLTLYDFIIDPNNLDFKNNINFNDDEMKTIFDEVNDLVNKLKLNGIPKAKLSTLMKAFVDENAKQTHTADDDCEKLAQVLFPLVKKFSELYDKINDFIIQVKNLTLMRLPGDEGKYYDIKNWHKFKTYMKRQNFKPLRFEPFKMPPPSTAKTWEKEISSFETINFNDIIYKIVDKLIDDWRNNIGISREKEITEKHLKTIRSRIKAILKSANEIDEYFVPYLAAEIKKTIYALIDTQREYKKEKDEKKKALIAKTFFNVVDYMLNLDQKTSWRIVKNIINTDSRFTVFESKRNKIKVKIK